MCTLIFICIRSCLVIIVIIIIIITTVIIIIIVIIIITFNMTIIIITIILAIISRRWMTVIYIVLSISLPLKESVRAGKEPAFEKTYRVRSTVEKRLKKVINVFL